MSPSDTLVFDTVSPLSQGCDKVIARLLQGYESTELNSLYGMAKV